MTQCAIIPVHGLLGGKISWHRPPLNAIICSVENGIDHLPQVYLPVFTLHWKHQKASTRISTALDGWLQATGLGETVQARGVIFADADNVIPDVVWVSNERLAVLLDEALFFSSQARIY